MYEENAQIECGMDLLTLFSPDQVDAIAAAIMRHGRAVSETVEKRQIRDSMFNNVLSFLGPDLPHDVRIAIQRTLGMIIRDALVTDWTEGEMQDSIVQATGCSDSFAADMVKGVKTDDDAALTRWMRDSAWYGALFDFGAADDMTAILVDAIDDLMDKYTDVDVEDNLFEWFRLGEKLAMVHLRKKLMQKEEAYEGEGIATRVEVAKKDVVKPALEKIGTALTLVKIAQMVGATAMGSPYSDSEAEADLAELDNMYRELTRFADLRVHPDAEQGSWIAGVIQAAASNVNTIINKVGAKKDREAASKAQKRELAAMKDAQKAAYKHEQKMAQMQADMDAKKGSKTASQARVKTIKQAQAIAPTRRMATSGATLHDLRLLLELGKGVTR